MTGGRHPVRPNAIAVALGLVGDEWNLLIVRTAIGGARRYNQWQEQLGIANSVLASRLRGLTAAGVLDRVAYQERPVRHAYVLTPRGRSLWRVLLTLWSWELHHAEHVWPIEEMRHAACGESFVPELTCVACGQPADERDVRGTFGPSGGYARSVPAERTRRRPSGGPAGPGGPVGPGLYPETMALIGNRWSAAMLAAAFQGAHRFSEFEQRLSAPPTVVAGRLRSLCDLGVLTAVEGAPRSDRSSYHLTAKGRAFFPAVMTAVAWGERWFPDPAGPAMILTHGRCGQPFVLRLDCSACGCELHGREVEVRPGRLRSRSTPGVASR